MDNQQLASNIATELRQAQGYHTDALSQLRLNALTAYYMETPEGKENAGRHTAVSGDVADMVESITAQMLPALKGDSIVEFEAEGDEDVEQAQTETDVVNNVIIERNMGYTMFQSAIRDALLLRNGWTKSELEERKQVKRQTIEGTVPVEAVVLMLAQLNEQPQLQAELVGDVDLSAETVEDPVIKITQTIEKFRVVSVDPVNMVWQADFDSPWIVDSGIRFLAERWYATQTDLIERGYSKSKVKALPTWQAPNDQTRRGRFRGEQPAVNVPDDSMRYIECYWVYYRYDSDGDGVAEQHRILYAGGSSSGDAAGTILEDEQVSFIPYATGTPFLQPHQLDGLGVFDKLAEIQDSKSSIWNDWLDNLEVNNFPETAVNTRKVELTDATNRRVAGVLRVDGEPGPNIMQLPGQDNGPSARAAMDYADKVRGERVGASLDMQTANLQIAGDTAHGIERVMSAQEMLASMMLQTIAETLIRQTYIIAHRGMREWLTQPLNVKVRGKFTQADPSQWAERENVNVASGLSIAERMTRRAVMGEVVGHQERLAAAGQEDILVDKQGYYAAVMDWGRASALDNPERYFVDPMSPESKQASSQKSAQAQQMQQAQLAIAQAAATAEQQAQAINSAIDKYKADSENAFKYWNATLQAQIDQLKNETPDPATDLLQARGLQQSEQATISAAATGQQAAG